MIVIIDYGLGNLGSIKNMLKKIGVDSVITSDLDTISNAKKIILPGVGSFDNGIKNLDDLGLIPILNRKVLEESIPILGICLGMQLFTKSSEEGTLDGLGWVNAESVKFKTEHLKERFSVPHMGWEYITQQKESKLMLDMYQESKFYFVHSYYVKCNIDTDVLFGSNYIHDFVSAFEKDNIIGVQFHPEKSHKFGMKLLKNFVDNY